MKEYTLTGSAGEYTVQLSDEEAKRLGATPVEKKTEAKAAKPANKARTAADKKADAVSKSFGSKANG